MLKIYIDGGSRGNPGDAAIGVVVYNDKSEEIYRFGEKIGTKTNNVAEYSALIRALEHLKKMISNTDEKILIYSDSELLVKQINGIYKVKNKKLKTLYDKAKSLLKNFKNIEIKHIVREKNTVSDWIVNRVLDNREYN
ncbi:MAG: ribonuclease H [Spirochaetes bacterium]|nr:MAG: ribonuclease H [Spirochaetota bacterium]